MKNIFKNVNFVNYYYEAPKNARYILRVYDDEWILEKYSKDNNYVISSISFMINVLFVEDFHKLLMHCRQDLVPKSETLWVEKPDLIEGNDPELNTLYKFCINDPITDELEALWSEEIFWEKPFPED